MTIYHIFSLHSLSWINSFNFRKFNHWKQRYVLHFQSYLVKLISSGIPISCKTNDIHFWKLFLKFKTQIIRGNLFGQMFSFKTLKFQRWQNLFWSIPIFTFLRAHFHFFLKRCAYFWNSLNNSICNQKAHILVFVSPCNSFICGFSPTSIVRTSYSLTWENISRNLDIERIPISFSIKISEISEYLREESSMIFPKKIIEHKTKSIFSLWHWLNNEKSYFSIISSRLLKHEITL